VHLGIEPALPGDRQPRLTVTCAGCEWVRLREFEPWLATTPNSAIPSCRCCRSQALVGQAPARNRKDLCVLLVAGNSRALRASCSPAARPSANKRYLVWLGGFSIGSFPLPKCLTIGECIKGGNHGSLAEMTGCFSTA
jgi:hypothetical protein